MYMTVFGFFHKNLGLDPDTESAKCPVFRESGSEILHTQCMNAANRKSVSNNAFFLAQTEEHPHTEVPT
jgi:hypothetical protein